MRQTTDARGRRRWRQASPPWTASWAPLVRQPGGRGCGWGAWPGGSESGKSLRSVPRIHTGGFGRNACGRVAGTGLLGVDRGTLRSVTTPPTLGWKWKAQSPTAQRPHPPSSLSPSIGYTLQDVPGRGGDAVPRVNYRTHIRSTVPGSSLPHESFRSRHGRTGGDPSWWKSRCTITYRRTGAVRGDPRMKPGRGGNMKCGSRV